MNHTHNTISMALHHLVGGLEHFLFFPSYWEYIIIPTDEVIFFRGVGLNHQPDMIFGHFLAEAPRMDADGSFCGIHCVPHSRAVQRTCAVSLRHSTVRCSDGIAG